MTAPGVSPFPPFAQIELAAEPEKYLASAAIVVQATMQRGALL